MVWEIEQVGYPCFWSSQCSIHMIFYALHCVTVVDIDVHMGQALKNPTPKKGVLSSENPKSGQVS